MKNESTTKNLAKQCIETIEEYTALFYSEDRTIDVVLDSLLSHKGDIENDALMIKATIEQLQIFLLNPEVLKLFHELNPYNTEIGIYLSKVSELFNCLYDTIAADELTAHWVRGYGENIPEEKLRELLRNYKTDLQTEKFRRSVLEAKPDA